MSLPILGANTLSACTVSIVITVCAPAAKFDSLTSIVFLKSTAYLAIAATYKSPLTGIFNPFLVAMFRQFKSLSL